MRYRWITITFLFLSSIALATPGRAVVLNAGDTIAFDAYPGTSASSDPDLSAPAIFSGSVAFDRTEAGFDGVQVVDDLEYIRGHLNMGVYGESGTGNLIFTHQLVIDQFQHVGPFGGYLNYTLSGFAGFDLDLDFDTDVGSMGLYAARSLDGDLLTFSLGGFDLLTGDGPRFIIRTNARGFSTGGELGIDTLLDFGRETVSVSGTVAPSAVPLPMSLPLLISALGGLGLLRLRSRSSRGS